LAPAPADTWQPFGARSSGRSRGRREAEGARRHLPDLGLHSTKALLEHAHALKVIRDAKEWGVTIPARRLLST
jgi:hypothetical protein